jgi:hypothetical protein
VKGAAFEHIVTADEARALGRGADDGVDLFVSSGYIRSSVASAIAKIAR